MNTFAIAAQPRTGSHMLATALGLEPHEMTWHENKRAHFVSKGQSGIIVHDGQWFHPNAGYVSHNWTPDKIVWLWREDPWEHAVSYFTSRKTRRWVGDVSVGRHRKYMLDGEYLAHMYASLQQLRPRVMMVWRYVKCIHTSYEAIQNEIERKYVAAWLGVKLHDVTTHVSNKWDVVADPGGKARTDFFKALSL